MSLCFLQTIGKRNLAQGGITEQEYLQHNLAHFQGIRHPQDSIPSIANTLAALVPWLGSLREIALAPTYEPLASKPTNNPTKVCSR